MSGAFEGRRLAKMGSYDLGHTSQGIAGHAMKLLTRNLVIMNWMSCLRHLRLLLPRRLRSCLMTTNYILCSSSDWS